MAQYGKLGTNFRVGLLMSLASSFLIATLATSITLSKNKLIQLAALAAYALTLTSQWRTFIIAPIMSFVGCLYLFSQEIKNKSIYFLFIILSSVFIGSWFAYAKMFSLESIYYRIFIWKVSLILICKNILWGTGAQFFSENFQTIANSTSPFIDANQNTYWLFSASHSHNIILNILAHSGLFSLISFLFLLYTSWKVIRKIEDITLKSGISCLATTFLFIELIDVNLYSSETLAILTFVITLISRFNTENSPFEIYE